MSDRFESKISRLCDDLAALPSGDRSDRAYRIARVAGGVAAGAGVPWESLSERLTDALAASGMPRRLAAGHVRNGLRAGSQEPIDLDDGKPDAPRRAPRPSLAPIERAARAVRAEARDQMREMETLDDFLTRKGLSREVSDFFGLSVRGGWIEHDVYRIDDVPARRRRELARQSAGRAWVSRGVATSTTLYGFDLLRGGDSDPIWLVNGESSVWAAYAAGVDAVCTCAGEGAEPGPLQVDALIATGRQVVVCYDNDPVGRRGAEMWADALPGSIVAQVPEELGAKADFGDAWVEYGDRAIAMLLGEAPPVPRDPNCLPERVGSGCPALPIPVPPGYSVQRTHQVTRTVQVRDEMKEILVCRAPIVLVGIAQDIDQNGKPGEDFLRLAWPRHGGWYEHDVARGDAADSRKLVAAICSLGAPFTSAEAKEVVVWIAEQESAARSLDTGAIQHTTRRTGWHGRAFVLYDQTIGNGPVWRKRDTGEDAILSGARARGDWDVWRREVASLLPRVPAARLALCSALAPSLLAATGCKGFTVQFAAGTGTGKSTMLELACSVWGAPSKGGLFGTWNNTRNGIEGALSFMWDIPVVLDDTKEVPNGDLSVVSQLVYDVTNGSGKGAMTADRSLRRRSSFRTVLVTSGEIPLLEESSDGGTRGRVITMRAGPFDALDAPSHERAIAADLLTSVCAGNHGHLGPMFASAVARMDWGGLAERYRDLLAEARRDAERISPGHGTANRLAKYVAVLRLAGELAESVLGVEPFDWAWFDDEMFADALSAAAESDRATVVLRDVVESALASGALWHAGSSAERIPAGGWRGRIAYSASTGEVQEVILILDAMRAAVQRIGGSWGELRTAAEQRGWWSRTTTRFGGPAVSAFRLSDDVLRSIGVIGGGPEKVEPQHDDVPF